MRSTVIRIVVTVAALAAVALLAGVWTVWKRPLAVDAWVSRRALGRAGLEKSHIDGPAGRLTVWEGGAGPTLVLLHGAGDQAGAWARVAPGLVSDHRLVIPDLPGHGGSAPEEGPLHLPAIVAGVEAVMDARVPAGETATLIGNSLGAWVAALYAVDHPDRVDRLVWVNGGPVTGDHPAATLMPENRAQADKLMQLLMGPATPPVPGFVLDDIVRWAHRGPVGRLAATAGEMAEYVLDGKLDRVRVPVDLVWGDADGLMDLDYAQRLLDGLPAARLTTVHGCGHVPQRECPDRFLKALTQALAQPAPGVSEESRVRSEETGEE